MYWHNPKILGPEVVLVTPQGQRYRYHPRKGYRKTNPPGRLSRFLDRLRPGRTSVATYRIFRGDLFCVTTDRVFLFDGVMVAKVQLCEEMSYEI